MYVCKYPRNFIFVIYFTGDNLVHSMLTPFSHALALASDRIQGTISFIKHRIVIKEYYYTSRTLYQHMKYRYKRKQIVMRPYGAT